MARTLARMYRPTLRKTVRDWHRGTQGWGPAPIVPRGRNIQRGPGLGAASLRTVIDTTNGPPPPQDEEILFQRGDVVVVLLEPDYAEFADEYHPFLLLRLSQPHSEHKTNPRSHVNGHVLSLTDDVCIYQQEEPSRFVFYKDLIPDQQGQPMVLRLGSDLMVIDGASEDFLCELDSDKVDEIMDAIDRLQYDMPQDESDEEEEADPELDGADREALQAMYALTGRVV